ncbi:putative ankyrin repeat protein RF_0381, partial [Saccostrea cucullata]|uniref:putative ankyrin repeat protein RF_0381 n=1 Tax=Saccostrea cuccullata TaxID=36930 RepID=UPI002ED329AD
MCSNDNNDKGNVLIVTIRSDIYNEAAEKRSTGESFFTNSVIDISNGDFQLQDLEIIEFFKKYGLDKLLESNTLLDIGKIGNTFGIPQCCNLLKNNPTLSDDTFGFLKNPIQSLQIYLKNILDRKECKTAVLVYILLCGGSVEEKVLQTALQDIPRKKQSLEIIGAKNATLMDFQRSIYHYHNFLITFDPIEREYKFSHSSVQESLFRCLVNFYPNEIIKSCDHVLLERLTTSKNMSWNSIVIPEEFFQEIIKRLLELLEETLESAFRTVSRLQIWKDEKFMSECERNQTLLRGIEQNTDSCGRTMLVHFCVSGNIRWVKYLLPSSSQEQRYMSLNEACEHNHDAIVDLILATDVKYNLKTCFHAVHSGNRSMLYRFTDNVDLKKITLSTHKDCNNEWGLLHEICVLGQNDLIKPVLTRYPQLLDVQNDEGGNALHFVAYAGDETVFKNLVQAGLDPYSRSNHGSTVLHFACQNGQLNMIRYICDEFPDMLSSDYNDNQGWSPLHFSAQSGSIELYEYFVQKGVQQTFSDDGSTPLQEACKTGKLEMCKFLVKAYPHLLNNKNKNGDNALHDAAWGGNIDLFTFLLEKGFEINCTNTNGENVLHLCCLNGKLDMCKYLVNNYPHLLDVNDKTCNSVLYHAVEGGNVDLFKFLLGKRYDDNFDANELNFVFRLCCLEQQLEMSLWPHLLDVKDENGNNAYILQLGRCQRQCLEKMPYMMQSWGDNIDLLKFLLEKVLMSKPKEMMGKLCFIFAMSKTIKEKSLHTAAWGGNIDLFKFLLEKGLDIKTIRNDWKTVLHLCCMHGKLDMCKYLVNTYPHLLDVKDNNGENALDDAARRGYIDIVTFLSEKGLKNTRRRSR